MLRNTDNALTVEGEIPHHLRQGGAAQGTGDDIGFGDSGSLCGERLRIAAGQHHDGIGIFPPEAAHRLPGFAVALGGDGAASDHIDIAARGMSGDDVKAFCGKTRRKHLSFILIDLAAKGVKRYSH